MGKAETIEKLNELIAKASGNRCIEATGELLKAAITEDTAELISTHLDDGGLENACKLIEEYARAKHGKQTCVAVSSYEAIKVIFDAWSLPMPSELAEPTITQMPTSAPTPTEQVDAASPRKKFRRISLDD